MFVKWANKRLILFWRHLSAETSYPTPSPTPTFSYYFHQRLDRLASWPWSSRLPILKASGFIGQTHSSQVKKKLSTRSGASKSNRAAAAPWPYGACQWMLVYSQEQGWRSVHVCVQMCTCTQMHISGGDWAEQPPACGHISFWEHQHLAVRVPTCVHIHIHMWGETHVAVSIRLCRRVGKCVRKCVNVTKTLKSGLCAATCI